LNKNILNPKVSVCIPVYNCEEYIGACIESVLVQTYKNFELIISDNFSTDKTKNIIESFKDPRIKIIDNHDKGIGKNFNKVLSEAHGNFIKILCADDILYPSCLELQVAALKNPTGENIVIVCCSRDVIDKDGNKLLTRSYKHKKEQVKGEKAIKENIRSGANLIGEPAATLFKYETMDITDKFDENMIFTIDLDFWCRLLLKGDLYIIPQPLCAFRVSCSSLSIIKSNKQYLEFRKFISKLYKNPKNKLSWIDCCIGNMLALVNAILRRIFYRVFVG
jgi:glycosyltransferase involved in cell wall biosynthesis